MRATYLTGETIYLRALTKADAEVAMAWRQSPFPISQFQAEKQLEEMHKNPWQSREFLFAICRVDNDEVVGSLKLSAWSPLRAFLEFKTADWLDRAAAAKYACEALRLALPWQVRENERPIVIAAVPAHEEELAAQAEALGMERTVRFRQHVLHHGQRYDLYLFQYIEPSWLTRLTHA